MDIGLSGKTVLITGATRNHGEACALAFAAAGANLILCTRQDMEALRATAEWAASFGSEVLTGKCDVGNERDVSQFVAQGLERFGSVDVMVHCAGWRVRDPLTEMSREHWEAALRVNVHALFHLCKAVLPSMKQNGWGRVVAYSAGLGPFLGTTAFGLSWQPPMKMAAIGFVRSVAQEYGEFGITANCVGPGNIAVRRTPGQARKPLITGERKVPIGRKGTPQDCAETAVFLASHQASYITGQNILVNGGGYFS